MPGKAAARGSPSKRSPAGPPLPSLLGSYRRIAVRGLGAEQYRGAQDMPVGGLHENRDALAGSGRIERECRLAAAPLAERRQAFDPVCIVERAARILTGTDLRPALLRIAALTLGRLRCRERVLPAELVPVIDVEAERDDIAAPRQLAEQRIGRRAGGTALRGEELDDRRAGFGRGRRHDQERPQP